MRLRPLSLLVLFSACAGAAVSYSAPPTHWSYVGQSDPTHWSALDPANAQCSAGLRQSPIALSDRSARRVATSELSINYKADSVQLVNNGHTIQSNVDDAADTVSFGGKSYRLSQFHYHVPSEHTLDGHRFPMELHFVNRSADGKYLVVGVFVDEGEENDALGEAFDRLPAEPDSHAFVRSVDLSALMPTTLRALTYEGSLTTPPCSEGVTWVVMEKPIQMSSKQIGAFRSIFPDNHRPLQPNNGRPVTAE